MKNKLLFPFIMLLCLSAGAQNKILITQEVNTAFSGHTWTEKVKNWPGTDYAVSLTGTDSTAGFCVLNYYLFEVNPVPPVFPLWYVDLPPEINHIYDFCVVDNYVFFCADTFVHNAPNTMFIGYFNLNDLVAGTIVTYTIIPIADAITLYKIAGFHDSHGFRLFAAGTTSTLTDNPYAIFEIVNPLTAGGYNFKYFNIHPPYFTERIDDIIFVGKFVIFVGRNDKDTPNNSCGISMRRVVKGLGLSDPDFFNLYYYTNPTPTQCEYNSSIRAIPLSDETFAIAYAHFENNFFQRVRLINIYFNNYNSQEYQCPEKYELHDLTYHRLFGTLTIVEPYKNKSQFVFLHPHSATPYIAGSMRDPQRSYFSIDTINSSGLISVDNNLWLMLKAPVPPVDSACVIKGTRNVDIIPNLTINTVISATNIGVGGITPLPLTQIPVSSILHLQCLSH